ncbi:hypothetical protein KJ937_00100 [Patescibacteria group bacterium]|nr:hypothetical protein [Patescibacteria group bacterium]
MKRKSIWIITVLSCIILCSAFLYHYYQEQQKEEERLDWVVACNEHYSMDFFEKLYFISNADELKVVHKLITDDNLDGAVAIYLPFAKKNEEIRLSVEGVARFVRESYHLALLAYDHDESWDYELVSKLFGVKVTQHCWSMGSAHFLKLGPRDRDDIRGCTSGGKNLTETELRKFARMSLRGLKNFVCREDKEKG